MNRSLTLRLNLSNLTDETYIRNVNNNGGRFNPGQPRAALLTSSVTFERVLPSRSERTRRSRRAETRCQEA